MESLYDVVQQKQVKFGFNCLGQLMLSGMEFGILKDLVW